MKLHEMYFEIRPEDIAYVKFVLESYEDVGIIRTVLRQAQHRKHLTEDRNKAVIVVLVVDDFLAVARSLLTSLRAEVDITEIPRPAEIGDDWLMKELATDQS